MVTPTIQATQAPTAPTAVPAPEKQTTAPAKPTEKPQTGNDGMVVAQASTPAPSFSQTVTPEASTEPINLTNANDVPATISKFFTNYPANKASLGLLQKGLDNLIEKGLDGLPAVEELIKTTKAQNNSELKYAILGRISNKTKSLTAGGKLPTDKELLTYKFTISTALLGQQWQEGILPTSITFDDMAKWGIEARIRDLGMFSGSDNPNGSWYMSAGLETLSFVGPTFLKLPKFLKGIPFLNKLEPRAVRAMEHTPKWLLKNPKLKAGLIGASHGANSANSATESNAQSLTDFAKDSINRSSVKNIGLNIAGAGSLAVAGATIGSLVFPGAGTIIGGVVGASLGAANFLLDSSQRGGGTNIEQINQELALSEANYTDRIGVEKEDLQQLVNSAVVASNTPKPAEPQKTTGTQENKSEENNGSTLRASADNADNVKELLSNLA